MLTNNPKHTSTIQSLNAAMRQLRTCRAGSQATSPEPEPNPASGLNPYQVVRDEFGAMLRPSRIKSQRGWVLRACSKIRKKDHADKVLKELARSLKHLTLQGTNTIIARIEWACAVAYDDMQQWPTTHEDRLEICGKLENALKKRLLTPEQPVALPHAIANTKTSALWLTGALGIGVRAIRELQNKRSSEMLTEYLRGLGYVREQLIAAHTILNSEGKKKYEAYIKNAVEALSVRFRDLKPYYLNILTEVMALPFRRSAEKDRREISDTLCLIVGRITEYRYQGEDKRYKEYAQTITRGINTDKLPPMIAGLIIQEVTALVDTSIATNVFAYIASGVTHEELWRHSNPSEYAEVYPDSQIPDDASPLEQLAIYPPQSCISQQSLWWGLDGELDCFITALAGGLLYANNAIPIKT